MFAETTPFVEYQPIDENWEQQNYVQIQTFPSPDQSGPLRVEEKVDRRDSQAKKRRKQATEREKRRMEKLNHCIEDIKSLVCPDMKAPTKAKILRVAIDRIQYLEKMTAELLGQKNVPDFDLKPDQILPKKMDRMDHSAIQKPVSVPVSDNLTVEKYVPTQPVNHVIDHNETQPDPMSPEIKYVYYSQEMGSYASELTEYSSIDSVQMGENSNSADSFGENGEFLAPVSSPPMVEGIQFYDENSIAANYYTIDTPFTFSYE